MKEVTRNVLSSTLLVHRFEVTYCPSKDGVQHLCELAGEMPISSSDSLTRARHARVPGRRDRETQPLHFLILCKKSFVELMDLPF